MKLKILLLFLCFSMAALAQEIPLNNTMYYKLESALQQQKEPFFTTVKPWLSENVAKHIDVDSTLYPERQVRFAKTLVGRKIFNENLIRVDTGGFSLHIDPVFSFTAGKSDKKVWLNSRGLMVSGKIGKTLTFGSDFYENQAVLPDYLDEFVRTLEIVPGQGRAKLFKDKGFDWSNAAGYISFTPSRYFNFRFGHGKNFIGDGYRSLLLSDNAFSYPYLKVTTTVWKLQYTNLWAQFQDRQSLSPDLGYQKKFGSFHYLNAHIGKRLDIGFFEAVIWESADSNAYRGFELNYLNPVIFFRPVEFSLGSPDNMIMGLNLKYRISRSYSLYGQLLLDEFNLKDVMKQNGWVLNKQGFQLGLAGWNVLNVPNLHIRTEYNYVRPYTYQHRSGLQCYGHYSQPLAHPYGANFTESVSMASYQWKYFSVEYKFIYAIYGLDTAGINYGKDIFKSYLVYPMEYDNKVGQGLKTTLLRHDLVLAYLINPRTNLRLEAGLSIRDESNTNWSKTNTLLWFGLSTRLFNSYVDL
jgi:hypothetical protein